MAGYQEDFIEDFTLPLPSAPNNSIISKHPHFSIIYDTNKKIAFLTAANVDASDLKSSFGNRSYKLDPNVPDVVQHKNEWYKHDPYDKGHMVRRKTVRWGADAEAAESASDIWTNIAPHSDAFHHDKWKSVEDAILRIAHMKAKNKRVSVFTGSWFDEEFPKLDENVNDVTKTRIVPNAYWKAVAYVNVSDRKKCLTFFWVSHDGNTMIYDDNLVYRGWDASAFIYTIKEVESKIGIEFPESWHNLGALPSRPSSSALKKKSSGSLNGLTHSSSFYWSEGANIDNGGVGEVEGKPEMTRTNSEYWGF